MNRTYSFVTLIAAVAISIVFGMVLGGKLNTPRLALAAPAYADPKAGPSLPLAPAMGADGRLDFADIAEAALPAVVGVANTQRQRSDDESGPQDLFHRWFFGPQEPRERRIPEQEEHRSFGSGFVVSADGYILSNNHVVNDFDRILVTMQDGSQYEAEVVGTDPSIDLALLKIKTEGEEFPYLQLGDSGGLRVGEWVLAIGNPLGFEQTVTVGVVSAKNRRVSLPDTDAGVAVFIQTDAAINLGNSGGPLLDSGGRVIGINTAINRANMAEGIGFALQIDEARRAMDQLLETGEVRRGLLGVTMNPQGIDRDAQSYYGLPDTHGVLVERVTQGGPADRAGVKPGDVIRRIDGRFLRENVDLLAEISSRRPGEEVDLEVFRNGKTFTTRATLTERTAEALSRNSRGGSRRNIEEEGDDDSTSTGLGLTVETFDPAASRLGRGSGTGRTVQGVQILEVEFGSQASDKGVEPGAVITAVNDRPVHSLGEWEKAIRQLEPGDKVKLDLTDVTGEIGEFVFLTVPEGG